VDLFQSGKNFIKRNNFIENKIQFNSMEENERSVLDSNYWDNWIGNKYNFWIFQLFPMIIFNFFSFYIDWHPQKEPYTI
jgi:hypothetical protein